jgi:Hemerythrin HHE cation binding domain
MDITQLILDDHHEQRRLFAILEQVDPADTRVLGTIWARLSAFLEVHAAAEEEIFYPELLRVGMSAGGAAGAEEETLDAIHDHNDIRDAIAAVAGHQVGTGEWFAAVAAVNLANGDHMAEEEREGLTDFRRRAGLELRHGLAVAFATFEAGHFAGVPVVDKDPETYVREAERDIAARSGMDAPDGSLGIGDLGKGPA